ncbi:GtrA family protein [Paenibacillus sp. sgz302251]|uniref:GtrA family protein n=1 Tax=Paenibacillus sp. sgz302251 TaxID=3414493 RepID=UPI003C7DAACC
MSKAARKRLAAQFVKFNLIGLVNTAIDFVLFTLLVAFGVYYLLAQIIAYGAGMANSFLLNNRYTFERDEALVPSKSNWNKSVRFMIWNGLVLLVSLLLLAALTSLVGLDEKLAKGIVTILTVGINFYGSKKWVFVQQTG